MIYAFDVSSRREMNFTQPEHQTESRFQTLPSRFRKILPCLTQYLSLITPHEYACEEQRRN